MSLTDDSTALSILREKKDREEWETSFKALAQPFFQVRPHPAAARRYRIPKAPLCRQSHPCLGISAELGAFLRGRKRGLSPLIELGACAGVVSCSAPAERRLFWGMLFICQFGSSLETGWVSCLGKNCLWVSPWEFLFLSLWWQVLTMPPTSPEPSLPFFFFALRPHESP